MQKDKINDLLKYAIQNIPYYSNLCKNKELRIEEFPIIEKQLLKENYSSFISSNIDLENILIEYTSGTTGIPFKCLKTPNENFISQRHIWSWRSHNVKDIFKKKLLVFSNGITVKSELGKFGESLTNNYYGNIDYKFITPRDLQEIDINDIITFITDYKPNWIRSTPSNLYYFCKKAEPFVSPNMFDSIKFIELSGETLEEYQVLTFKKIFNCFIGNHYGCREVWPIACECECGSLHVFEEHVYCEIVNKNKYTYNMGELCITSLNQYSFPYIRYNTGDIVSLDNCDCKCGRSGLIIKNLYGRKSDYINIDGKYYTPQLFSQPIKKMIKKGVINPKRFFIVEININCFNVYLEQDDISNDFENYLIQYFKEYVSVNIRVDVIFCKQIPSFLQDKNKYFFSMVNRLK